MTTYRKVKKVIGGDTIKTRTKISGTNFVRIANIDAPELHQFGGYAARDKLKRQIQGKVVTLQPVGRSYNRVVAKVRHNRRLIR